MRPTTTAGLATEHVERVCDTPVTYATRIMSRSSSQTGASSAIANDLSPVEHMEPNTRDEEAALPVNAQPQRPRSAVPSLLFIGFMVYMLTSHNGDEFLARHQYQDVLQTLTYHLSNYSSWMNGTSSNFSMV